MTKPKTRPHFVQVPDAVNADQISPSYEYALAYIDGHWPTYDALRRRLPHCKLLTVATTPHDHAAILDVEAGDATELDAVGWVRDSHNRLMRHPTLYTSVANANSLVRLLAAAGLERPSYRLWTAHWTGEPHLCGYRCGLEGRAAGATQFSPATKGRTYDLSWSSRGFLDAVHRDSIAVSTDVGP